MSQKFLRMSLSHVQYQLWYALIKRVRNSIEIENLDLTVISGLLRNLPKSPTSRSDLRKKHYGKCKHIGHSKCCSFKPHEHLCKTCRHPSCGKGKCCMSGELCNHPCSNSKCSTPFVKCRDNSTICCDQIDYKHLCNIISKSLVKKYIDNWTFKLMKFDEACNNVARSLMINWTRLYVEKWNYLMNNK